MTVEEYKNQLKCINDAYVKFRTDLDKMFLDTYHLKYNVGDVVNVSTITGTFTVIIKKIEVKTDEYDNPDVYVTESVFARQPEKMYPIMFKLSDIEK